MTNKQKWVLLAMMVGTLFVSWTLVKNSSALRNYRWFKAKVVEQKKITAKEQSINEQLRRKVVALQYDHRVIERVARDHLSLTREGEIIVILPR
ncbi:MAG TPA: hypothetical protein DCE42_26950 [Myxococcales bacterium]|nr:hypothetical protein [Deltaproteobacteria bacterium]MBU52908.1 hypothetical protein [Deltaproteobacteria bacterium]HAA58431.1 hypothetical protein [Myxococcales bacterium]|tara:strand:- start:2345 stop:2626 length:282 start_codon:yes stop_codon:yes gene_type:complete